MRGGGRGWIKSRFSICQRIRPGTGYIYIYMPWDVGREKYGSERVKREFARRREKFAANKGGKVDLRVKQMGGKGVVMGMKCKEIGFPKI